MALLRWWWHWNRWSFVSQNLTLTLINDVLLEFPGLDSESLKNIQLNAKISDVFAWKQAKFRLILFVRTKRMTKDDQICDASVDHTRPRSKSWSGYRCYLSTWERSGADYRNERYTCICSNFSFEGGGDEVAMFENPFWFSSASLQSVSNLKANQKALLERVDSNVSRA